MPKVSQEYLEARRQQILDAASECFAKKGFHGTTMHDIVDESGLSPGAIYRYFSGKDEIIDEIARGRHERETALLRQALVESGGGADLKDLARSFFHEFAATKHRKARRVGIEVWAEALRNPVVMKTVRRGVDEPRELLVGIVRDLQERGQLSTSLDAHGLASVMVAIFQGFVLQQAWQPRVDTERYLATIDALLDALGDDGSA